jgi:hypothetical protein
LEFKKTNIIKQIIKNKIKSLKRFIVTYNPKVVNN